MKIGILTFHRALNYGAVLQAYALSRHINKKSGCSCEIIDYICPKIEKDYKLAYFTLNYHHYKRMLRKYMNLYRNYKRKKAFKNFNKVYLPLSNIQYSPSNI